MSDEYKELKEKIEQNKQIEVDDILPSDNGADWEGIELLVDYITNLQDQVNALVNVKDKLLKENERLKKLEYKFFYCSEDEESFTLEDYLELGNKVYDLQQENERLKECYCNRTDCSGRIKDSKKYDSVYQEKEDYKSRVEKTNEYIEEHITADSNDDGDMWYTLRNNTSLDDFIINIRNFLQGGKDDK